MLPTRWRHRATQRSARLVAAAFLPRVCLSAALLVVALLVVALPAAAAAPVISAARIGQHDSFTRIVFSISHRVPYQVFTLENPDRVVVDLPAIRWSVASGAEPQPAGVFEGVRHGRYKTDVSRLVIDLRQRVTVQKSALLTNGSTDDFRLMIDLVAAGGGTVQAASHRNAAPAAEPAPPATQPLPGGATIGLTGLAIGEGAPPAAEAAPGEPGEPRLGATMPAVASFAPPRPRPSAARRPPPPRWVVAIDPGHGGTDPGAIGVSGIYEKHITLATARALRDELTALGRYKVVMTRNRDTSVRLRDRIAIARAAGANLFISVHADKMPNAAVRGLSLYTLSERASDAEAAALAERENKSDLLAGINLTAETTEVSNILIDLVQRETMNQSAVFAGGLVRELRDDTLLLPKTHRFAGFAVLKAPDVPSVLVELGYLSNPADEQLLRTDAHRRKLARGIARAVDGYFVRVEARNRQ